jgi:hypothetical protein
MLAFCFNATAYALDTAMLDLRNRIFKQSNEIKNILMKSGNSLLLNSMFDTCLIAVTQIDAYFSMLAIFESIDSKNLTQGTTNYLINWLEGMRNTNTLNVKNLDAIGPTKDPTTDALTVRLKSYFNEMNRRIDVELGKMDTIRKTAKNK